MSVVEVVIGVVIASLTLVAVVSTVMSAGRAQQRAKVRQQMAASADDALDSLRSSSAWITTLAGASCAEDGCPITLDAKTLERVTVGRDGREFEIAITGWPVDSDGDGVGAADADRVVPDYVRVSIRMSMSAAQQEQFGTQRPFTTVSTIDMTNRGGATGTLVVQTCEVANQVDERARIDGCDDATNQALAPQPAPCRTATFNTLPQLMADASPLALGCNDALDAAAGTAASGMLVRPTSTLGFRLSSTGDGGARITRVLRDAQHDPARGTYTFVDIPAGTWSIDDTVPGPGYEIWASKAVPSDAAVTVPPGRKAQALLVQRLVQGRGTYTASFTRTVQQYTTWRHVAVQTGLVKLGPSVVSGTATFHYRLVQHSASPRWSGSAWNGSLGTESKPAGRYADDTAGLPAQRRLPVRWQPRNGGGDYTFEALGTGLHNSAEFRTCGSRWYAYHCGYDTRSRNECLIPRPTMNVAQTPTQVPGEPPMKGSGAKPDETATTPIACNDDSVWIEPEGNPNVETRFHSEGGECYLDGNLVQKGAPRYRSMCDDIVREGVWQLVEVESVSICTPMQEPWRCDTPRLIRVVHPAVQGTPNQPTCYSYAVHQVSRPSEDENGVPYRKVLTGAPACETDHHGNDIYVEPPEDVSADLLFRTLPER